MPPPKMLFSIKFLQLKSRYKKKYFPEHFNNILTYRLLFLLKYLKNIKISKHLKYRTNKKIEQYKKKKNLLEHRFEIEKLHFISSLISLITYCTHTSIPAYANSWVACTYTRYFILLRCLCWFQTLFFLSFDRNANKLNIKVWWMQFNEIFVKEFWW